MHNIINLCCASTRWQPDWLNTVRRRTIPPVKTTGVAKATHDKTQDPKGIWVQRENKQHTRWTTRGEVDRRATIPGAHQKHHSSFRFQTICNNIGYANIISKQLEIANGDGKHFLRKVLHRFFANHNIPVGEGRLCALECDNSQS